MHRHQESADRPFMTMQKDRKVGNSLIITIVCEEAGRLGLVEGDLVAVSLGNARAKARPLDRPPAWHLTHL